MASLFRLRRCNSAATRKRSYTSSGMFFNVIVVGIIFSNHYGTIMVPLYNPSERVPIRGLILWELVMGG